MLLWFLLVPIFGGIKYITNEFVYELCDFSGFCIAYANKKLTTLLSSTVLSAAGGIKVNHPHVSSGIELILKLNFFSYTALSCF